MSKIPPVSQSLSVHDFDAKNRQVLAATALLLTQLAQVAPTAKA